MSWWFDLAVLAVFFVLLAAMPWKQPHPNHIFALDLLRLLAEEDSEPQSGLSSNPGLDESHEQTEGTTDESATA